MKIRSKRPGPSLLLELEGELDAASSAELEERCLYEQQEGALHFVFDLGGVSRITGSGLRVLLGLARSLPRAGGSLVLCNLARPVSEALHVSGFDAAFEKAPERASALRRSREMHAATTPRKPLTRAEAEAKVDYAIELLAADESPSTEDDPRGGD